MSLLLPEQLRIGLGASYAVLARVNGAKVTHWQIQTWNAANPSTPWQQALTTVSGWLAELKPHGLQVVATLSAELAPLHLLPWRDDVVRAEQQALLAAAHFRRIYSETAEYWKIVARPSGYGKSWLASAMDERLLQALNDQLQSASVTLTSVMPLTVSLFNALRTRLSTSTCWLLVPEPERLTALHVREKQWSLLQTLPMTALQHEPLADLLLRETRLAGLQDMMAKLFLVSAGKPLAPFDSGCTALDPGWQRSPAVAPDNLLHLLGGRP